MTSYNTNLAVEFHVLAVLHRLGATANLTLGNKKGVDIIVAREAGDAVTVEVKGVAGKYDWPANNLTPSHPNRHFVVLVSFEGQVSDPKVAPRCWIVPFKQLDSFLKQYRGRRNVSRAAIRKSGARFEDAWAAIMG